jgi:hypothetical protein
VRWCIIFCVLSSELASYRPRFLENLCTPAMKSLELYEVFQKFKHTKNSFLIDYPIVNSTSSILLLQYSES